MTRVSLRETNAPRDLATDGRSPYVVQAVTKTASILRAFEDEESLSLVELSERTSLPKPSVFRLATSLESVGLLDRDPDGRYVLGLQLISLARVVLSRSLGLAALPIMEELHRSFGHSVNLATLSQGEMVFLETLESRHSFRLASAVGAREAVHCTSVGKAVAAYMPTDDLDRLFAERPLRAATARTITSRTRFDAELTAIRARGYSTDMSECYLGCNGVGAAVFDRHGLAGGISVSAPSDQIPEEELAVIGESLRDATRTLSLRLGANPLMWSSEPPAHQARNASPT